MDQPPTATTKKAAINRRPPSISMATGLWAGWSACSVNCAVLACTGALEFSVFISINPCINPRSHSKVPGRLSSVFLLAYTPPEPLESAGSRPSQLTPCFKNPSHFDVASSYCRQYVSSKSSLPPATPLLPSRATFFASQGISCGRTICSHDPIPRSAAQIARAAERAWPWNERQLSQH